MKRTPNASRDLPRPRTGTSGFTIYTITRPGAFQRFAAASPSLWWNYGAILQTEAAFLNTARPKGWQLDLTVGELEQPAHAIEGRTVSPMRSSLPPRSTQALADRLSSAGVAVSFTEFSGMGHGPTFKASLARTLRAPSGPALSLSAPQQR